MLEKEFLFAVSFQELGHRRQGQTALSVAVSKNNKDLVRLLLKSNSNKEHEDAVYGETPLFIAVHKGKLPMVHELVKAGCNIHHLNKKAENVLFTSVKLGKKDLVEYFLNVNVDVDVVNSEGSTALLLALELYENYFQRRHVTRKSSPTNVKEIITALVPKCSCLNHLHPNKGSALRIALNIEAVHSPHDLSLTKLLLRHGATPDRVFFLRYGGLVASNTVPGAEFFTESFFNLAITAGANLQREKHWLLPVLSDMPEELAPHLNLFNDLLSKCSNTMSLQLLCIMRIRQLLVGPLWKSIDVIPLPGTLKDSLKLIS